MTALAPTATERAYAALRTDILSGARDAGARLGEDALAEELGLSRTPVREALQRLGTEGLVEHVPHRGARVVQVSVDDLAETFELRALLEGQGARRAATRATTTDVAGLRELCTQMECSTAGARDLDLLTRLNSTFHARLLELSASPRLTAMVASVVHVPLVMRTFHRYSDEALARSQHHHREICDALERHDGDWACSVMRSHIFAARTLLLDPPTPAPDDPAQESA